MGNKRYRTRRKRRKLASFDIERTQNINDFFFTEEDSKGFHVRRQSDNKRMADDAAYVYSLGYFYINREMFKIQDSCHRVRKVGK